MRPRVNSSHRIRFLGLLLLALSAGCRGSTSNPPIVPAAVVGDWSGSARIVNDWVEVDELIVELAIDENGRVRGRVGDAVLTEGRLGPNRGGLGRLLRVQTDWIVTGDLEGPLIEAEGIQRRAVKIPLDLEGEELVGGLHSSGRKLGSESRIVSATDLTLVRDPE